MKRDILISTPAKRYARAFLDVSIRQRNFSIVLEELETFQEQIQSMDLLPRLFINPAVPESTKTRVLMEIGKKLKFQELTLNFLKTLIHRDRLNLLNQVIVSAEQQFLEKQGILVVEVISAKRLKPDEEQKLAKKLEDVTGKKIQLENKIDAGLIGGAITRIGTTLYDGSIQAQLEQMRRKILEG